MRVRAAERRDTYWSWLGPLCLALFGLFIGLILGRMTLTQMLHLPDPIMTESGRMLGRIVGSAICLAFPVLLLATAFLARRPRWIPNIVAFFLVGFIAYVYSVFIGV